jgi:DNA-directed RNA polymerase subunit E'/Rpb7
MEVKTIQKWINIKPYMLGDNFMNELTEVIKSQFKNTCSNDLGHIMEILDITRIITNHIENSSSEIVVLTDFEIEVFNPRETSIVEDATVCAVYTDGLLVDAHGVQKILIPSSTYSETHTMKDDTLVDMDSNVIKSGDVISVSITAVRYNDHRFSCIGVIT